MTHYDQLSREMLHCGGGGGRLAGGVSHQMSPICMTHTVQQGVVRVQMHDTAHEGKAAWVAMHLRRLLVVPLPAHRRHCSPYGASFEHH